DVQEQNNQQTKKGLDTNLIEKNQMKMLPLAGFLWLIRRNMGWILWIFPCSSPDSLDFLDFVTAGKSKRSREKKRYKEESKQEGDRGRTEEMRKLERWIEVT
ncbi:hypothetical protein Dimus_037271, partial [Dionaea muscipula]